MYVSQTLMGYLDRKGVDFELVTHRHTACSHETARAAKIEPKQLAKATGGLSIPGMPPIL